MQPTTKEILCREFRAATTPRVNTLSTTIFAQVASPEDPGTPVTRDRSASAERTWECEAIE